MDRGQSAVDPFAGLKEATGEYHVYDSDYERIGKVDDLLVDDTDRVLYIGVKMGFFGSSSTIVPVEVVRVNDKRQLVEVMAPEAQIKDAPYFGHRDELTPEFEDRVRTHFGLAPLYGTGMRTGTGGRHDAVDLDRFAHDPRVDVEPGERAALQRGTSYPDAPLDEETARRDIAGSGPPSGTARPNLDIPLDEPAAMSSSEPRRETVSRDVAGREPAGGPVDRWDELDSTGGGVRVHRKRG
jgi:hypothetical protein